MVRGRLCVSPAESAVGTIEIGLMLPAALAIRGVLVRLVFLCRRVRKKEPRRLSTMAPVVVVLSVLEMFSVLARLVRRL